MASSQTWLVTGATRGIGLGIVRQLLLAPANVVFATCRNSSSATDLESLKNAAETLGKLHVVQMDVTDEASISRAKSVVENVLRDAGLDYLINNAGVALKNDTPSTLEPKVLIDTMTANVAGPALVTKLFMPLIQKGHRKVIVNMSTSLASIGLDFGGMQTSYSISKAAFNMLNYKQAKEHHDMIPFLMDPGWVKTDMGGHAATLEPHESAAGIVNVVSNANKSYAGCFYNYKGDVLPW